MSVFVSQVFFLISLMILISFCFFSSIDCFCSVFSCFCLSSKVSFLKRLAIVGHLLIRENQKLPAGSASVGVSGEVVNLAV